MQTIENLLQAVPLPESGKTRQALHGAWLGHALHPVLTDIPIGAWTAAAVFDAGGRRCETAATAATAVGLVGAAGAAITGIAEFQATGGESRRTAATHGLLNVVSTGFMLASLFSKNKAKGLRLAGYAVSMAAAYLGGHLVFKHHLGTDHSRRAEVPETWTPVMPEAGLTEDEPHRADAGGFAVLLVRRGGRIHALSHTCAHQGGPLSHGNLEGNCIRCPWHGSLFDLDDGRPQDGPSAYRQPVLAVRVRDGQIEVRSRRDGAPARREAPTPAEVFQSQ